MGGALVHLDATSLARVVGIVSGIAIPLMVGLIALPSISVWFQFVQLSYRQVRLCFFILGYLPFTWRELDMEKFDVSPHLEEVYVRL